MKEKIYAKKEKSFSAHHMLLGASRMAFEDAQSKKPGYFHSQLICLTMAALSLEAICNAIGVRVIKDWGDFERSDPSAKLRIICGELGIPYNARNEPWSTARWLQRIRNEIAHAKPEMVVEQYIWSRAEYENRNHDEPLSKLEKKITLGNAKRALDRTNEINNILCGRIPPEHAFGLWSNSWSGSASTRPDE